MNEAMRRGSIDNISALVLFFKHDSGFNETTLQGELGLYRVSSTVAVVVVRCIQLNKIFVCSF